jgi:enamine deaminase RidA (YjgF/YER057c/UK114 family)
VIVSRLDPPGLLKIPEIVNVSVATGSRMIHVSGQVAVNEEGKVEGTDYYEQARHALRYLKIALEAAGAALDDIAKVTTYVVNYSWEALEQILRATRDEYGEMYPRTANTLIGVSSLWLPELLVEVEALAIT